MCMGGEGRSQCNGEGEREMGRRMVAALRRDTGWAAAFWRCFDVVVVSLQSIAVDVSVLLCSAVISAPR